MINRVLCLAVFASCACATPPPQPEHDLVIASVSVIDIPNGSILNDLSILVADGQIVGVIPAKKYNRNDKAFTIDGAGKFLMPGLADMHVHLRRQDQLLLYVANGVLLVRDMWGGDDTLRIRNEIASGDLFGPTVIAGSPGLDGATPTYPNGPTATTADEAAAFVRNAKLQGYDFIKTYDRLTPDALRGLAAAAVTEGMPFAGHAPMMVPFDEVLDSGIASLEHGQGYMFNYLEADVSVPAGDFDPQTHFPALMQEAARRLANGGDLSDLFNAEKRDALAKHTANSGVWNTPTLVTLINANTPSSERAEAFSRAELKYLHPKQLANWTPEKNFRFQFLGDPQLEMLRHFAEETMRLVVALNRQGAGLMIGTDAPEAFVMPGFSVHRELELFVEAGISPADALAAATSGPARFLDQEDTRGCIAVGCVADLVLLDANPLMKISNTRTIAGVVLGGEWHSRADLDARLEQLATSFVE